VAGNFTASTALYRLSTSEVTLSDINNDFTRLNQLLNHKQRERKLWQETRDPACKMTINWRTKIIRRMTRKKVLEWLQTKTDNFEVTPQGIWPIAKSLIKGDEPINQLLFMVLQVLNFIR
jgi:hypothetical protein